ncbi:MAG: GIY-YIG nuclease family protein [Candidatus Omnitrophota bacterium]
MRRMALSLPKGLYCDPMWYLYILRCADRSFYVGITDNLTQRLSDHNEGKGARHTRSRLPMRLVHKELFSDKFKASQREKQIKGWSHNKKRALIEGDLKLLSRLSRSSD